VRAITDAGLPCGVFLAPVLPGLTDGISELDAAICAISGAGATGVTVIPLHLRPGAREWFSAWLERAHPQLVPRYRQLYAGGAYVPAEYRAWLSQRVAPLLGKYGLDRQQGDPARQVDAGIATGVPGGEEVGFPAGSLPSAGVRGVRPTRELAGSPAASSPEVADQLSLL
jgi:hypothetical protein